MTLSELIKFLSEVPQEYLNDKVVIPDWATGGAAVNGVIGYERWKSDDDDQFFFVIVDRPLPLNDDGSFMK